MSLAAPSCPLPLQSAAIALCPCGCCALQHRKRRTICRSPSHTAASDRRGGPLALHRRCACGQQRGSEGGCAVAAARPCAPHEQLHRWLYAAC
eukprot:6273-Heterococcus_DN1.PRE.1